MSLDLTKFAGQISRMAAQLKNTSAERRERLELAVKAATLVDVPKLQSKITNSRTTWLIAGLVDRLAGAYTAPPPPSDFTVLATDGSHIDVDRNQIARCFLINIGRVVLSYGKIPTAMLDNIPRLYAGDAEMVIIPAGARDRGQAIEGALLGIKRAVEECASLAELARELPTRSTSLALMDGSLILWGLTSRDTPEFIIEELLQNGMLRHLDTLKQLNKERQLIVASYISYPRSNDVANALRVALCPHELVDTDKYCTVCNSRECDKLTGIQDRDLYGYLLQSGERSPLFVNRSSVVREHYGAHQIHFFYLKGDEEIARIEIPQWVAEKEDLLNLAHTLLIDQCHRGQGYPVALSEAHEQAVVTGADRENFWQLVEAALVEEQLPAVSSAKSQSKRTRWV